MPGHHVEVFLALCLSPRGVAFACDAPAAREDRTTCQIVNRVAIRTEGESEIAIAELIEHAAAPRWYGRQPAKQFHAAAHGVEGEKVSGVAVNAKESRRRRVPDDLTPAVCHVARRSRV